ncbi:Very-long-chain aldehyde decarbonylase GL1-10 (Protein GLOSSY 1-10) [Durusdinium trenchii]|uniref:Very-long-chain aldehyde decarbonylase GL1-10 (Protein GLOSSY 1-10) n=1 Tax=Durusdinium trenchii TaxID=1381693 RepID=A0ABP0MJW1_9DINO
MNSSRILGDLGITDAKSADRLCPDTCEGRFARSPLSSSRLLFYESQVLASHVLCPSSRAFACAQLDLDCALRLLSGDLSLTLLELITLGGLAAFACVRPEEKVNVEGSWSLKELTAFLCTKAVVTRIYNTYLEAIFFSFPEFRTQPSRDHALKNKKDLCGRDMMELQTIIYHDRLTLLSQFAFNVGLYYAIPGYYPAQAVVAPLHQRALRLVGNHYLLSFGMYWMHRALHVVPWLWDKIHSYHHWAKHPLSRNTYDDHWLDNLGNAVIGHFCAQVLLPLDRGSFWLSHLFRIFESLEKHSGVSCGFNLAHQMQRFLPFAQMPHHHDWHHEGHKGSNYTFTSMGGLWDCVFGTRKVGRATEILASQVTWMDRAQGKKAGRQRSMLDHPVVVLTPVFSVAALAFAKLHRENYSLSKRT